MAYKLPSKDAPYYTFGLNLTNIMEYDDIKFGELVERLNARAQKLNRTERFTYGQVHNWSKGLYLPNTSHHLVILSQVLDCSIDKLIGITSEPQNTISDHDPTTGIIQNIDEYIKQRRKVIVSSKQSLWIQVRTSHFINEISSFLIAVMGRGVKVRLLACDPNDEVAMSMITRRKYRAHTTIPRSTIKVREAFEDVREDMRTRQIDQQLLSIRVTTYMPSNAIYISDPYAKNGTLFAVTGFYKIDPYCSPVVLATQEKNPTIFRAYRKQFALLWRDSVDYET